MAQVIQKSDASIHRDVLEELAWDTRADVTPGVRMVEDRLGAERM